jgi:hypothetical protein
MTVKEPSTLIGFDKKFISNLVTSCGEVNPTLNRTIPLEGNFRRNANSPKSLSKVIKILSFETASSNTSSSGHSLLVFKYALHINASVLQLRN